MQYTNLMIRNLKDNPQEYLINGFKVFVIAYIYMDDRKFIVYKANNQVYVEELVMRKSTDLLYLADEVKYIEDEQLWKFLVTILQKEGII